MFIIVRITTINNFNYEKNLNFLCTSTFYFLRL